MDNVLAYTLWQDGLNDKDAAKVLGAHPNTYRRWRKDRGLPANGNTKRDTEGNRRRVESIKKHYRRQNLRFPQDVAKIRLRIEAARMGWPGFSYRQAKVLEFLYQSGPTSRVDTLQGIPMSYRCLARVVRYLFDNGYLEKRWGGPQISYQLTEKAMLLRTKDQRR